MAGVIDLSACVMEATPVLKVTTPEDFAKAKCDIVKRMLSNNVFAKNIFFVSKFVIFFLFSLCYQSALIN